jgi:micrococcal nuclease
MKPVYIYQAVVDRVVDGDTIDCTVDLGFNTKTSIRFRIFSGNHEYFDTPEVWRPKTQKEMEHGRAASQRAQELLQGKKVVLKSIKKGKYRYLAEVFLADGRNYADVMIQEGFQKNESYHD